MGVGASTEILTCDGFVPVEKVKAGDEVWTMIGWSKVSLASLTGVKPTCIVTLRSGKTLRLTGEHLVFAVEHNDSVWIPASLLHVGLPICATTPVPSEGPF